MIHLLLAVIYLSFISLGLPDSLLGAAWPSIYPQFQVPVSWAGIISMLIAVNTVISSLSSHRLTRRLGTGRVTLLSVAMTAAALMGFSCSSSFFQLCLWAVPYGLGAGSVDAALNNYVALHFTSRHMSWLHCMWGVGASLGPSIMGYALTGGQGWNTGYRYVGLLQLALTAILLFSLPLWNRTFPENVDSEEDVTAPPLSLRQIFKIPGALEIMLMFFLYSTLEQTAILWSSSYLSLQYQLTPAAAASYASLFCIGITLGRGLSGFLTIWLRDNAMIRLGQAIIAIGILTLLLPFGQQAAILGLILIGLGCAPIYPCAIHSTPAHFGAENSQAVIGVQMASAYTGTCLMPPLFGLLASASSVALLPMYLMAALLLMSFVHERLLKISRKNHSENH